MKLQDFLYDLPDSQIAKHPPKQRGNAKLLIYDRNTQTIQHDFYYNLDKYLQPNDVVILNNTKVLKARLTATNKMGTKKEILLLEAHSNTYDKNRMKQKVMYRGKIHENEILTTGKYKIRVDEIIGDGIALISSDKPLIEISDAVGSVPLPPYLKRDPTQSDTERYQTEFAQNIGSVAAPTASLNFTNTLKEKLSEKNIKINYITLHVGIGTFMPIRTNKIEDHTMHSEYFHIPKKTTQEINMAKKNNKKVIAVGTTVTRTLEFNASELLSNRILDINGEADIFIYPGYDFKLIDGMLTNFHAPKSTVLMMVASLTGWDQLKAIYREALAKNYMFLSYGDSMLIL